MCQSPTVEPVRDLRLEKDQSRVKPQTPECYKKPLSSHNSLCSDSVGRAEQRRYSSLRTTGSPRNSRRHLSWWKRLSSAFLHIIGKSCGNALRRSTALRLLLDRWVTTAKVLLFDVQSHQMLVSV